MCFKKKNCREKVFNSNEDIINAVNTEIEKLQKQDFEKCFKKWL